MGKMEFTRESFPGTFQHLLQLQMVKLLKRLNGSEIKYILGIKGGH